MIWLLVAVGGVVGAPARYLVDRAVTPFGRLSGVPLGTISINVIGSALLGVMVALVTHDQRHSLVFAAIGTGFCGAFTTFSTFTWETLALAEDGMAMAALANLVLSLTLGIGAAAAAYLLT